MKTPKTQSKNPPTVEKSEEDWKKMILLILLYTIQGVPLGLSFGSIPLFLQKHISLTEIGVFSITGYPYALKLLWSPLVDTFYFRSIGRRKTWIIPLQILASFLLLYVSKNIDSLLANSTTSITEITILFLSLVFISATQDIAVDGWAVSLISKKNKSYAATCQNIGLSIGMFNSYSILVALTSPEFCNNYLNYPFLFGEGHTFGDEGLWSLSGFIQFWAYFYFLFTVLLMFYREENQSDSESPVGNTKGGESSNWVIVKNIYYQMYDLLKRENVRDLVLILLICKIGYAAEMVSSMELLELGFKKEYFAILTFIDFPLQFVYSYIGGKVSSGQKPLLAWFYAHSCRMVVAFTMSFVVFNYPEEGALSYSLFSIIIMCSLVSSASISIINVSQCGYFTRISDNTIGGTYMTLLTTICNVTGNLLTFPILYFIDYFTISTCISPAGEHMDINCMDKGKAELCSQLYDGSCKVHQNGFILVNSFCIFIGLFLMVFIYRKLRLIHSSPASQWRVKVIEKIK